VTARFLVDADMSLAADIEGSVAGVPVLLLHGGGQTRHSWKRTSGVLADAGYRVISVDQRGHGDSDWASGGAYALDDYARDVRSLVDQVDGSCLVVGASLGGLAALLAAGEAPGIDCAGLVLVDVAPRMSAPGRARIRAFMRAHSDGFDTLEAAADAVARFLPHRSMPVDVAGLRANLRTGRSGRFYWHWDPAFLELSRGGARDVHRLERALAAVDAPMLLVRGLRSEVVTDESVAALRAIAPGCEYVELPDAAHMVAGDRNDMFCETVQQFLLRVTPPGRTRSSRVEVEGNPCRSA
jgi:pimeloyl-ACP methyl ester carboxylesterase